MGHGARLDRVSSRVQGQDARSGVLFACFAEPVVIHLGMRGESAHVIFKTMEDLLDFSP